MKSYEVLIRLFMAIVIAGLIGYEREHKNRPAGFRTHILVCVGATIISLIQLYAVQETSNMILLHPELASALKADIGRLGAQVVTGVGFLGAGTIIHEKGSIKGLTTAASLWVVACIGLAIGLGYYFLSIASAVFVFLVLVSLKKFETRFLDKTKLIKLQVQYVNKRELVKDLEEYFDSKGAKVKNIEFAVEEEEINEYSTCLYTVLIPRNIKSSELISELVLFDEVVRVTEI